MDVLWRAGNTVARQIDQLPYPVNDTQPIAPGLQFITSFFLFRFRHPFSLSFLQCYFFLPPFLLTPFIQSFQPSCLPTHSSVLSSVCLSASPPACPLILFIFSSLHSFKRYSHMISFIAGGCFRNSTSPLPRGEYP